MACNGLKVIEFRMFPRKCQKIPLKIKVYQRECNEGDLDILPLVNEMYCLTRMNLDMDKISQIFACSRKWICAKTHKTIYLRNFNPHIMRKILNPIGSVWMKHCIANNFTVTQK